MEAEFVGAADGLFALYSAAYAMVAYQTAYLKANYPDEFLSAMTSK